MPRVGVRELKNRTSEIVRAVRERGVRYIVTHQGNPVGVLLPLDEARVEAAVDHVVTGDAKMPLGQSPPPRQRRSCTSRGGSTPTYHLRRSRSLKQLRSIAAAFRDRSPDDAPCNARYRHPL